MPGDEKTFTPKGRFGELVEPLTVDTGPPVEEALAALQEPPAAVPQSSRRPSPPPMRRRGGRIPSEFIMPEPAVDGRKVGYARVSTEEQTTALQFDALKRAGCTEIVADEGVSGMVKSNERPKFAELVGSLKEGDTLVVWRLDRLGRSLTDLVSTVERLHKRGIGLLSLNEKIDTTNAAGKMIFHVFCAMAQFERDLIAERTVAGLKAARERGQRLGRPRSIPEEMQEVILNRYAEGTGMKRLAKEYGFSYHSVWRLCRGGPLSERPPYVEPIE